MQAVARWRNLVNLKGAIPQSTATAIASKSKTGFADFHSTSTVHEKWKAKWNFDVGGQRPSKNYMRYKVHQKRADAKKALRDLLLRGGSIHIDLQAERNTAWDLDQADDFGKKDSSKSSHASRRAAKAHHRRMKRKYRREKYEESDDPDNVFQACFWNKWCTWTYWSPRDFTYHSSTGFEWKEPPKWNYRRQRESDNESESDTDSCVNDMYSEREALGLPLNGPLKIEEIKTAFRLVALKWHPDKHQGPSQAMAEEKFKQCVDAYKSLCTSVSTA